MVSTQLAGSNIIDARDENPDTEELELVLGRNGFEKIGAEIILRDLDDTLDKSAILEFYTGRGMRAFASPSLKIYTHRRHENGTEFYLRHVAGQVAILRPDQESYICIYKVMIPLYLTLQGKDPEGDKPPAKEDDSPIEQGTDAIYLHALLSVYHYLNGNNAYVGAVRSVMRDKNALYFLGHR